MLEDTDTAQGQLQRVDHLIYVTLKYTRTADVILNALQRLVDAMDYIFEDILELAKRKGMVSVIPKSHVEKTALIEEKVMKGLKPSKDAIKMYFVIRKLLNAKNPKGREEYRKNVTLVVEGMEVNQERLMEFFVKTKEYYAFTKEWLAEQEGKKSKK